MPLRGISRQRHEESPAEQRSAKVAASWVRAAETAERQKEAERGQRDRKGSETERGQSQVLTHIRAAFLHGNLDACI